MSSMEVEYQISIPEEVSSSPTIVTVACCLLLFLWVILRKFPETSGKSTENSEDGGKLRKCTCIYPAQ
jgi:hypothetical protein